MTDTSNSAIEKRVRYFDGQYLKADDFIDEQKYHVDRQRRPFQYLHVSGILNGLAVTSNGNFTIALDPGSAIDAQGRQILLQNTALIRKIEITKKSEDAPFTLELKDLAPNQGTVPYYLVISHSEVETDKQGQDGSAQYRRFHERPIVDVTERPTAQDIPLAKLTFSTSKAEIDPTARRYSGLRFPTGDDSTLTLRSQGSNQIDLQGNLSITGNTGLGTTSSSARLEVKGATDTANAIALSVTNSSTQSLLSVRNDGNIGIGTSQPNSRLSVSGGVAIGATYANTKPAPQSGLLVEGNLGIGTPTPNRKLELVNDVAGLSFEAGTASPDAGAIRFGDKSGWKLHFGRSRESSSSTTLNAGTAGVLMTIKDNGNVGIANTNPEAKLDISGTSGTVLSVGLPAVSADAPAGTLKNSTANIDLSGHIQLKEYGIDGLAYLHARDDSSNRNIGLRIRTQKQGTSTREVINALTINPSGSLGDLKIDGSVNFGNVTRQMITLWEPGYGIGIQNGTQYFRTDENFAWYKGGSHSDAKLTAGSRNGTTGVAQMTLEENGNLAVRGTITTRGTGVTFSDNSIQLTASLMEAGTVAFGQLEFERNPIPNTGGQRAPFQDIVFSKPFVRSPTVHVALQTLDCEQSRNLRISTRVQNITTTGFRIYVTIWSDTIMYTAGLSWIAFSS